MFVTSDIYDLKRIGRFRDFDWRENLLAGIAVDGTQWAGPEAAAGFLVEAARRCDLLQAMKWAGYKPSNASRMRPVVVKSMDRIAHGELAGAKGARGVLLKGVSPATGSQHGNIMFGGEVSGSRRTDFATAESNAVSDLPRTFGAHFIYPLAANSTEVSIELFKMSVDILGAEYGYYFVRDELCFPDAYSCGIAPALDYSARTDEEAVEISDWARFARNGGLWSGKWPRLRDLYAVNLLSERHTAQPVEGLGYLTEWISAQPGRGRLEDIGSGRWLWSLSDVEMFNVRPLLNKAGLLLSCHDRVYRDL